MKVFLGGTCNESTWRDKLIPLLNIDYFNPVVPDWTPECMAEEILQRETCDYCLYVITPKMTGVYSIAEVVDDSNKRPEKTLFCVQAEDDEHYFTTGQMRSLGQVGKMVEANGGKLFQALSHAADYLNGIAQQQEDQDGRAVGQFNQEDQNKRWTMEMQMAQNRLREHKENLT